MRVASFLHRVMTSVACQAVPCISTLSHKRHDFQEGKKYWTLSVRCYILYNFFQENFPLEEEFSEMAYTRSYVRSSCKVPVIIVRFQSNLNIRDIFSKNAQISILMPICPVGAELL